VSVDGFLAALRQDLDTRVPRLLPLFDVMAGEARFARAWLDEDLKRLPKGAPILEVGGGVFILACLLAREGFAITSIEPTGGGFGAFGELGAAVLAFAARDGDLPTVVRCGAEEFTADTRVALAFSMNVMEHVDAPDAVLARVSAVLLPGASYRFLCPNYLFPYEPHFNIPTFGSKALTRRLMRHRIEENAGVDDPAGVWRSLNWITVPQVRRMAATDESLLASFQTGTLVWMLERAVSDAEFARRRAGWMVAAVRALGKVGLLSLAALVPATFQPIMDVRLTKRL
jgi:SAM-dependent methyltransferase